MTEITVRQTVEQKQKNQATCTGCMINSLYRLFHKLAPKLYRFTVKLYRLIPKLYRLVSKLFHDIQTGSQVARLSNKNS